MNNANAVRKGRKRKLPASYRVLSGSKRRVAPKAERVGDANPKEKVTVGIVVRRRPGHPPLPDQAYWARTPPRENVLVAGRLRCEWDRSAGCAYVAENVPSRHGIHERYGDRARSPTSLRLGSVIRGQTTISGASSDGIGKPWSPPA
jgi:hypothetical protein